MKTSTRSFYLGLSALIWAACTPLCLTARAQEGDAKPEATQEAEKDQGPDLELAEDADVETVEAFISRLEGYRPKTREEYMQHYPGVQQAIAKATDRLLKMLEEAGETGSPRYLKIKRNQLSNMLPQAMRSEAQVGELQSQLGEFFAALGENLGPQDAQLAVMAGYYMSNSQLKDELKQEYCQQLAKWVKAGGDATASSAEMLEGIARSVALVGENLELAGTTLNGKEFAIADLKGKVVLVDFWATWCGPCIAEHPNLEKNYAGYKSKGFEIVGVSLDSNREQLEKFCEDHDTQWIVLHDEGGKNPATTYYGIVGIPSMFLLDQTGKVVSTDIRGPKLAVELAKLLGEPEVSEEPADAEDKADGAGL